MKQLLALLFGLLLSFTSMTTAVAHVNGVSAIHEVLQAEAPQAEMDIKKDPTGGFNVRVKTLRFRWAPEKASLEHVNGEGHAHVYLDGRKIMRIYDGWFHLNTFQFALRSGEQLLSIELVGNDHAPYTVNGLPVGTEALIDAREDEIQPKRSALWNQRLEGGAISITVLLAVWTAWSFRRKRKKS